MNAVVCCKLGQRSLKWVSVSGNQVYWDTVDCICLLLHNILKRWTGFFSVPPEPVDKPQPVSVQRSTFLLSRARQGQSEQWRWAGPQHVSFQLNTFKWRVPSSLYAPSRLFLPQLFIGSQIILWKAIHRGQTSLAWSLSALMPKINDNESNIMNIQQDYKSPQALESHCTGKMVGMIHGEVKLSQNTNSRTFSIHNSKLKSIQMACQLRDGSWGEW